MRKMILILILFSFFTADRINAQFADSSSYFPLKVGNKWVYNYYKYDSDYGTISYNVEYEVTKDTIILDEKYYFVNFHRYFGGWIRFDTISGYLVKFGDCNGQDTVLFNLGGMNNPIGICCKYENYYVRSSLDTVLFNINTHRKEFYNYRYIPQVTTTNSYYFAKSFGLTYSYDYLLVTGFGGFTVTTIYKLLGCVIDGNLYGDTTVTLVSNIKSTLPESFSLSQNYPNPFNPSTKIKFDIPKGAFVKLKIYDMLGREVAVLVNEKLNPGTYEYEWNGINLPSGVYFYKIEAENFIETKRMVLVK